MEQSRRIPPAIRTLAEVCEGFYSSRGIRKAQWRLYYALKEIGWDVEVTKLESVGDTFFRPDKPAVTVKSPTPIVIEVAKQRLSLRQIERLKRATGIRVVVLIWGDVVRPWEKRRATWRNRRVTMEDVAHLDYIIGANTKPPIIHTPATLAMDHEAELSANAQRDLARRVALQELILKEVGKAWESWEPVSCHGNVEPHRHLPRALKVWGYSEAETKRAVRELIEQQILEQKKHRKSMLRGLAITDKLSCPNSAPDYPHMPCSIRSSLFHSLR